MRHLDVSTLAERSGRLDVSDLDFSAFGRDPLDPATLRCLRYMHDVEFHTVCYLRDLLVTRAHRDPDTTAFLSMWVYEEYWHGEAIARVLAAHGEVAGPERVGVVRRRSAVRSSVAPWLHAGGSVVLGDAMAAIQVAWGAINEWTTQAGYGRLATRSGHPVLSELLARIMRQEGRHIDFYASRADHRLAGSPRARSLTRTALRRFWTPVGAGAMPDPEVAFTVGHLFGGSEGRAAAQRIDRRVDRLPGLAGLGLVERAVDRYALPARSAATNIGTASGARRAA